MTAPATASSVPGFSRRQLRIVLGALVTATLLAALDTSIVTTALPTIAGQFNAFEHFAWVGTAYIATATLATPVLGRLSDLYGRRRLFTITMTVFLTGSLLCGLAQSMGQLIAFRAVQGLGGGAVQALAFAMLGDILPPRERGKYIGLFTIAFVGSAVGGPLVGGLIVEHWTWPWIFFVQIPPGIAATVLCHRALRLPFPRRQAKLDWLGALLLAGGLGTLMIGLENGRTGWARGPTVVLLATAAVLLAAFVVQERRVPQPMIPPRLFRDRVVLCSALMGCFAGAMSFGAMPFLPLYFQDSRLISPTTSGLWLLPVMVGVMIGTTGIGRLIARTGRYRRYPILGTSGALVGVLAVTRITATTSYLWLIVPMVLIGIGTSSVYTTTSIATQNAVDFADLGVATATVMFFRTLGGSLDQAVNGTVMNATVRSRIPRALGVSADEATKLIRSPREIRALPDTSRRAVADAVATGVGRIYLIAAVAMAGAVVCAWLLPERPLRPKAGLTDAMEGAG